MLSARNVGSICCGGAMRIASLHTYRPPGKTSLTRRGGHGNYFFFFFSPPFLFSVLLCSRLVFLAFDLFASVAHPLHSFH